MILIRVDASSGIGYGHLMRCISLAVYFRQQSQDCLFVLHKSDPKASLILDQHEMKHVLISEEAEISGIAAGESKKVVILDVNNNILFSDKGIYRKYIEFLRKNDFVVASFEEFSTDVYPANLVIIPYVGAKSLQFDKSTGTRYLLGPDYFIFRDEFLNSPKAVIKEKVEKVFICMGGSDADMLTEKYLGFIADSLYVFDISIVMTNIDAGRKKEIQDILSSYRGKWEIILDPKDITSIMVSCDIGVVNSGLIKYETCLLELPCITVSNNDHHEAVMSLFSQEAGVLHLGLSENITEGTFMQALSLLTAGTETREKLKTRNRAIFDGKGKERVYQQIFNLINAGQ